ncbi:MAG: SCO family protein [Anaerolineae bacterium]|nr:SCO family protein [Anaerolineae bacterium]
MITLALLVSVLLAACGSSGDDAGPSPTPLPGTILDPPKEVADFTLTDHTGQPFSLSDLRGKVVMLFFGYTNCPDVCPTTLAEFKQVKAQLGEDADQVAFVFVSVDGARDTPERLAAYVHAFDPDFIGLTGDDAAMRTVGQDYGIFYQRVSYDNPDNYLVDHTASSFVVDQEGRYRIVFPYQSDPAGMAEQIRRLVAGQ